MSINYLKELIFCKKIITLLDIRIVKVEEVKGKSDYV